MNQKDLNPASNRRHSSLGPLPSDSAIDGPDELIGSTQFEVSDIAGGCIMVSGSALISCGLLILNGAFVMALLSAIAASGSKWLEGEKLSQFLLFSLPLALLIVQWYLIDTARWILRRRAPKKM